MKDDSGSVSGGQFAVLLVGDGNFSFTSALCRQIWRRRHWVPSLNHSAHEHPHDKTDYDNISVTSLDSQLSGLSIHSGYTLPPDPNSPGMLFLGEDAVHKDIHITTTSFDSEEEVLTKYPESVPILARLHRYKNVKVLHRINAWTLSKHFPEEKFDMVVWNHPHLGVEDFRLHRLLLAHFFHSAVQVLKPLGVVSVSVVNDQDERWNIVGQAARAGLAHVSSAPFSASDYRGYICKRNKNGESFKNHHTLTHHGHDMWSATHKFALPREDTGSSDSAAIVSDVIIPANSKARPRQEVAKPHQCPHCMKRFKCDRGLSVHVRQVHELKKYGEDWRPDRERTLQCGECGKAFGSEADLWQHQVSQHKFDAAVPARPNRNIAGVDLSETVGVNSSGCVPETICDICGAHVPPGSGLEEHLESLKPVPPLDVACEICGEKFIEHRARRQHMNYCRVTQDERHPAVRPNAASITTT